MIDTGGVDTSARELHEMDAVISAAPALYQPSRFWRELGRTHAEQLATSGFDTFKRTVNTRYFNWRTLGILRHQFAAVATAWLRQPQAEVFSARFPDPAPFNPAGAWIYKTFVALYADVLEREDSLRLLHEIGEPELGHPFLIRYKGRDISQDLCNSIHEFYSIFGREVSRVAAPQVCEIGAGYGRLAHVVLSALPRASYCIVDIPPALHLSQRYLTTFFPDRRIFRFRPFRHFDDVRKEFEHAQIRFLAAPQIELLPDGAFDQFVNISSLHEMNREQVENYFRQMGRLCRGRVYTKQWRTSRASVNGCVLREDDYPVPSEWRTIYHRTHPVQRMFFEALYEVASSGR